MHRLIIHKLGPIEHCELECAEFVTFTGYQASGKSTIAKAVYYFRTIKDDIIELAKRQAWNTVPMAGLEDDFDAGTGMDLMAGLENYLRDKSLSTFGSSYSMPHDMYMEYYYTRNCFIKIFLCSHEQNAVPNYLGIEFSDALKTFLQDKNHCLSAGPLGIPEDELKRLQTELYKLFEDNCTVVYIPAGRTMITLLSGLAAYASYKTVQLSEAVHQALKLIKRILRGTYKYSNGEERIVLDHGGHVKIAFSSSGQQECVWILNLLFYYLLQPKRMLFIIEEPESHLFPASQKYITELISLVCGCGHSVILTTHSPYVLGTLNNLLYADTFGSEAADKADEIIPKIFWLDYHKFHAWFVKNGTVENCMDIEIQMIQNERIDEISKEINSDFDRLMNLNLSKKISRRCM